VAPQDALDEVPRSVGRRKLIPECLGGFALDLLTRSDPVA
jgi:hypothetical protein